MAYKIMNKDKINTESKNLEIANDKGVNSSDWLGFFLFVKDKELTPQPADILRRFDGLVRKH